MKSIHIRCIDISGIRMKVHVIDNNFEMNEIVTLNHMLSSYDLIKDIRLNPTQTEQELTNQLGKSVEILSSCAIEMMEEDPWHFDGSYRW